jgi:hypothetical protein
MGYGPGAYPAGGQPSLKTGTRDLRSVERAGVSLFEAHHDDEVVTMMMNVVTMASMVTLNSTPAQSTCATLHAGAGTHLLLPLPTKSETATILSTLSASKTHRTPDPDSVVIRARLSVPVSRSFVGAC